MKSMLVSIIIPVYNVEEYIVECLESVLKQEYSDLEVVIVNDCTPDHSMGKALATISKLKERINVIVCEHEKNAGLSVARNTGVEHSNGEYVYFLDSDDTLFPNSISSLVAAVTHNEDIIMGNFIRSTSQSATPVSCESFSKNSEVFLSFITNRWNVMACNKLIRRKFMIENAIVFEKGLLHEDELFSFVLALHAESMLIIDETTYWYRMREGAITSQYTERNVSSLMKTIQTVISMFEHRSSSDIEEKQFHLFVVQKCYIAMVMTSLSNPQAMNEIIGEIRHLLGVIKKHKTLRSQTTPKYLLIYSPNYFISIYMILLKMIKSREV